MGRLAESLYSLAIALWVGGICAIGYLAAPVLFQHLSDRTLAGILAGAMFTIVAYVGLACGTYLLLFLLARKGWRAFQSGVFWIVLFMAALTAAGHFGIQPIIARIKAETLHRAVEHASELQARFATWHGISMGVYSLVCLLGLWLVVWQDRGKH